MLGERSGRDRFAANEHFGHASIVGGTTDRFAEIDASAAKYGVSPRLRQCRREEAGGSAAYDVRRSATDTTRRARCSRALSMGSSNSLMLSCVVTRLTP